MVLSLEEAHEPRYKVDSSPPPCRPPELPVPQSPIAWHLCKCPLHFINRKRFSVQKSRGRQTGYRAPVTPTMARGSVWAQELPSGPSLPASLPRATRFLCAFKQALLEGGGCLIGALGWRHCLRGGIVVMHHGGDTVAHSSFVAPVRETRKEWGWRVWFVAHAAVKTLSACDGNDQAPREPMAETPAANSPFLHPEWMESLSPRSRDALLLWKWPRARLLCQ